MPCKTDYANLWMFPEQLSWRHAVNIPLLPADVEQHRCPRVTLNRSFRWSLLYYTTDILQTLFPRMCESCRGGVSFIGKAGSEQCVSKGNTRCRELPCAALGHRAGASTASPAKPVSTYGWESACCLSLQGCWPAFVSPTEGECSHSDSSKPNILWYRRNSGLAHLFPLWLIFLEGEVFSCRLKLIFDAWFGLGTARWLFLWRDISRFL